MLPIDVINIILSFRPRHPIAVIMMEYKEEIENYVLTTFASEKWKFQNSLFRLKTYVRHCGDTARKTTWKTALGNSNNNLWCYRVRRDYEDIYGGAYLYVYQTWKGMYVAPTEPNPPHPIKPKEMDMEEWNEFYKHTIRRITGRCSRYL